MAPHRRDVLASVPAGALAGCLDRDLGVGPADAAATTVALETIAGGFAAPVAVAFRPGDDRPYVVDQPGRIHRVPEAGEPSVVADLRDRVVDVGSGYTEQGLLGLAFHPDGGRAYVRYSAPRRDGTPEAYSHTFALAEFEVGDAGAIDLDSERTLLEIPQPQANHNAGDLAFGPDGFLYVAVGDGGGGGDRGTGHVEDWDDANAGGNGQDVTENLLGSILRVDVDASTDGKPYGIPADNPLVDGEGLDEHYAWGLRNPWRMAFDGDRLIVADVGQNRYEEVDVVENGGNYGWNVREGRGCYDAEDCPTETPDGDPLLNPVLQYDHDRGIAVVGGEVYRGDAVPELGGRYVFGDWRGGLLVADPDGDDWAFESLGVDGGFDRLLLAFGAGHDGELYVVTDGDTSPAGDAGELARVTAADASTDDGTTTSGGDDATTDSVGGPQDDDADATPGFGALGALAAVLGGLAELARRRRRR